MSIFEYDQEKHMRQEREAAWEEGRKEGHRAGVEEGRKEGHRAGVDEGHRAGLAEGEEQMLRKLVERKLKKAGLWRRLLQNWRSQEELVEKIIKKINEED